jgi:hypothetical protein
MRPSYETHVLYPLWCKVNNPVFFFAVWVVGAPVGHGDIRYAVAIEIAYRDGRWSVICGIKCWSSKSAVGVAQ